MHLCRAGRLLGRSTGKRRTLYRPFAPRPSRKSRYQTQSAFLNSTHTTHPTLITRSSSIISLQQSVAAAAAAFLQNYYHYYSECVIQCFKIEKNNWFYQKLDAKNITFRCFLCRRVADLILAQFPFEDKAAYLQKNTRKVGWLSKRALFFIFFITTGDKVL